jgi:hypothetical protein
MSFFKYFSQRWHELPDGEKVLLCNLTRRVAISPAAKTNQTILLEYEIQGNERPEVLSYRLYGTKDYWWVVLMVNNILDVNAQWPLNSEELEAYIEQTYGEDRNLVHHWTDIDGNVTDPRGVKIAGGFATLGEAARAMSLRPVTNEYHETLVNDAKRQIVLVDPTYIDAFGRELETVMSDV